MGPRVNRGGALNAEWDASQPALYKSENPHSLYLEEKMVAEKDPNTLGFSAVFVFIGEKNYLETITDRYSNSRDFFQQDWMWDVCICILHRTSSNMETSNPQLISEF